MLAAGVELRGESAFDVVVAVDIALGIFRVSSFGVEGLRLFRRVVLGQGIQHEPAPAVRAPKRLITARITLASN